MSENDLYTIVQLARLNIAIVDHAVLFSVLVSHSQPPYTMNVIVTLEAMVQTSLLEILPN